ncbi:MAG: IPT/TIG domain-containing protein [Planctomycetes bacterium]|nr:IPT/TIG domain-containing protein [Planctomycetota bacterium]
MPPVHPLALSLCVVALTDAALAQNFNYPNFANTSTLTLNGSAGAVSNVLRVTNNGSAQVGSAFHTAPVSVAEGFDTQFQFVVTSSAEGMAFVVHGDPQGASALGGNLWGLGYGFGNNTAPIANCLAIEIDAVQQGFLSDTSANELSVHTQGTFGNSENEGASIARLTPTVNMKSGTVHTLRVNYIPGTLEIYLDNMVTPALTTAFSFENGGTQLSGGNTGGLGLGGNLAWVGFTGTTTSGSTNQRAEVQSWSWVSNFAPDACYVGNAGSTAGGPYDVLQINGGNGGFFRKANLHIGDPFSIGLVPPPGQANAPFVLLATVGIADETTVTPTTWGNACFPLWLVLDIGSNLAPYTLQVPPGILLTLPLTFQAVMATDNSNPGLVEISNAVAVEFSAGPAPQVTNVNPKSAAVGSTITITGTNFSPFATLDINGTPVPTASVTATTITFLMPAGVGCNAALTVHNPDTTTATTAFNPVPVITSTFNNSGPTSGGTTFIHVGTGFAPGTTVTIGGTPANVTNAGPTIVVCTTPPGTTGQKPVVITTPGGCTVNSSFTYL